MHMAGNGYTGSYAGGGIGSGDMAYDTKVGSGIGIGGGGGIGGGMGMGGVPASTAAARSQASLGQQGGGASVGGATRSLGQTGSIRDGQSLHQSEHNVNASSPLMGPGTAGIGSGGGIPSPEQTVAGGAEAGGDAYQYKAKALYAYTANPDDPNEISFQKGEVLDILDKQGKWWQAKKEDGTVGSEFTPLYFPGHTSLIRCPQSPLPTTFESSRAQAHGIITLLRLSPYPLFHLRSLNQANLSHSFPFSV